MSRYSAQSIYRRLITVPGYVHAADLAWLEKEDARLSQYSDVHVGAERELIAKIFAIVYNECTGEAHRNPYIDNCYACMPRWGVLVNREKVHP